MSVRKKWNSDFFSNEEDLLISKLSKYGYGLAFDDLVYLTEVKERQIGLRLQKNIKIVHDLKNLYSIKKQLKLPKGTKDFFIEKISFDDFYHGFEEIKSELESLSIERFFEGVRIDITPEALTAFKQGFDSAGAPLGIASFDWT